MSDRPAEEQAVAQPSVGDKVNAIIAAAETAAQEITDKARLEAHNILRMAEQQASERITELTRGCDRAVIGYRLRREFYTDDFSNGIENIAVDSQFGFNSAVVLRTLKLKDLPWNGWLRLGIDIRATAAWNPVAGFTDAPGRLV